MPLAANKEISPLTRKIAAKLEEILDIRDWAPETWAEKTGGAVSPSYIRDLVKGRYSVTVEVLDQLLRPAESNLGLFFEEFIEERDVTAQDRRYKRILQRALDSPDTRDAVVAIMKMVERDLKGRKVSENL